MPQSEEAKGNVKRAAHALTAETATKAAIMPPEWGSYTLSSASYIAITFSGGTSCWMLCT